MKFCNLWQSLHSLLKCILHLLIQCISECTKKCNNVEEHYGNNKIIAGKCLKVMYGRMDSKLAKSSLFFPLKIHQLEPGTNDCKEWCAHRFGMGAELKLSSQPFDAFVMEKPFDQWLKLLKIKNPCWSTSNYLSLACHPVMYSSPAAAW